MAKTMVLYEHRDETGATLEFYHTKRDADAAVKDWLAMGCETQWHTITYTPTRKGVCALLNSIKEGA